MASTNRTALFSRKQPGGVYTVADVVDHPGNIWFVDSSNSDAADSASAGRNPDIPFATLAYAFSSDVLTAGDTVYVMPGHTEAPTTAITLDIAGINVIGLGTGTTRPQITGGATSIDNVTITAADIVFDNFYFNEATVSAATANINIAAANVTVRNCHMDMGANDRIGITITAAGEKPVIEHNVFRVTADGPDAGIDVEGVIDHLNVQYNTFIGSDGTHPFDVGCIDLSSQALTSPVIMHNVFDGNDDAGPLAAIYGESSCVGDCFSNNFYAGGCVSDDTVSSVTATIGAGAITSASFATGAITAAAIASDAIAAAELADDAIDAATFATDALQAFQDECEDALEGENLDHLVKTALPTDMATDVHADSVIGEMCGASDMSTFDRATDSLEAIGTAAVAIAAKVDDTWDAIRNGTGGAEPATNRSVMDYLGVTPAFFVPGLGYKVSKTESIADDSTTDDLFDVTGQVLITNWTMEVATDAVGADLNDYKLRIKTDNIDLCAASDIHGDVVGQIYMLNSDAGDGVLGSDSGKGTCDTNGKGLANRVVGLAGGSCTLQSLHTDPGASTATLKHVLWYLPLEASAAVAAAS